MSALRLDGVWKAYPRRPTGGRTVRELVARRTPLLLRRGEERWALRDVDVDVPAGASLAIIGRNGAGKSTLLRLASGIGRPTRGRIDVPDDSASVLSLGHLFDPQLSGRENALTGALLTGWSRAEARALVPRVLEFAELEDLADEPVRTYSDGMRLRLAFGVVAQLAPSVLLLDEVLAVGDLGFHAKCAARIAEMRAHGTQLVIATHDMREAAACDLALWLEAGAVRALGPAGETIAEYEEATRAATIAATPVPDGDDEGPLRLRHDRVGTQELTIEDVAVPRRVRVGDPLELAFALRSHGPAVQAPIVAIGIHRAGDGVLVYEGNTAVLGTPVGVVAGEAHVRIALERTDLLPGAYDLDLGVYSADWATVYDFHWHAYRVAVDGPGGEQGVYRPALRIEVTPQG